MLQEVKRRIVDRKIDNGVSVSETVSRLERDGNIGSSSHRNNGRVKAGSCTFHEDPNLWFPELPSGRPTRYTAVEAAIRVREATDICSNCPIKQSCLDDGFLPENILWGIWGGMMAGERLVASGITPDDYSPDTEQGRAFALVALVEPWL